MSNNLAVPTVTATLSETILPAAQKAVTGTTVSFRRPDDPAGANTNPRINIFLYQITPNVAFRNADLPVRRLDGSLAQRPQTAINLHYLLTFYGDEAELEPQRLLGSIVSTLHARPLLTHEVIGQMIANNQNPNDAFNFLVNSDLAQQPELVKFSPLPLNLEELSKLWSVFFQTPYVLSVAYQASVVLLDSEESPGPALPVRDYNVYAVPFAQPVIEKVVAASDDGDPILTTSTLRLRGRQLKGQITRVRLAGQEVAPATVTDQEVMVTLTTLPANALRAGVQGVQVIHPMELGTPPTEHRGVESNVAPFVLRPVINSATASSAGIAVNITPIVGKMQRLVLLLNKVGDSRTYTIIDDPRPTDTANQEFFEAVEAGDYLIRVQVDGAESLLAVDDNPASPTFGSYVGPRVTVP